jgi:hypothetical protein
MRDHTWVGRVLRVVAVVAMVVPFIGYFAPVASAHTQILSVSGACNAQTQMWDVTWTIASDPGYGPMSVYVELDGSDITSSFAPQPIPDPGSLSTVVHYDLSDTGTHTLFTQATWSRDGFTRTLSKSIDLSTLDSSRCAPPPQTVTVSGWLGSCRWTGASSETPVTVVIDPESGATVTITGPGGPYEFTGTGGSVNLGPGDYAWTATAADGYTLTGDTSGAFTVEDCPPPPPSDVSVTVTPGSCSWNGESSETPVTVVIDPESGATVTITGPGGPYEFTGTGGSVNLGPGDYAWTATAADGYTLTGPGSGEFTAGDCPPPPPRPDRGSITVVKITKAGVGTFSFSSQTLVPSTFDLTTTQTNTPVSRLFAGLDAGVYDVAEGVLADGWSLTSATCSDGSTPDQIVLSEGENVTCTFTNSFTQVAPETVVNTSTTPETLPFTGGTSTGLGGVGIGMLLLGGLMLLALRGRDETAEDPRR